MKCGKLSGGGIFALLGTTCLLFALAGCEGTNRESVTGTFKHPDGTPVVGARVTARCSTTGVSASGTTDANGQFTLGTTSVGEGVPPGEYYLLVVEPDANFKNPGSISPKYGRSNASGLSVTVQPGEPAVIEATLDPP